MDVFESFKAAQRAGWAHFAPLQAITTGPAARLVRYASIRAGQSVLDVACGTGVVAITAARGGAQVTGLDLTPELLEVARENGRVASVSIDWHEGDVEHLPFDESTFDTVVSQYGHMFAPRRDVSVAEMLRVLKPGGVIAFSTWPPELFVGQMFAPSARYTPPPPPGVAPPPNRCGVFRGQRSPAGLPHDPRGQDLRQQRDTWNPHRGCLLRLALSCENGEEAHAVPPLRRVGQLSPEGAGTESSAGGADG